MQMQQSSLLEQSVQIAREYLEGAGEIDDPAAANRFLSDTIELMMRRGTSHRLILANKAIAEYKKFRDQQNVIRFQPASV